MGRAPQYASGLHDLTGLAGGESSFFGQAATCSAAASGKEEKTTNRR